MVDHRTRRLGPLVGGILHSFYVVDRSAARSTLSGVRGPSGERKDASTGGASFVVQEEPPYSRYQLGGVPESLRPYLSHCTYRRDFNAQEQKGGFAPVTVRVYKGPRVLGC